VLREVATKYPHLVEIRRSEHEMHLDALFVVPALLTSQDDPTKGIRKSAYGEVAHVHYGFDFSAHVVPSPADCKHIIERGWAERHPCSGRLKGLPKEYLLLYTPRNDEELEVFRQIIEGAVFFNAGEPPVST